MNDFYYYWRYERFFDPLGFYMPKNLKEIFKYARYFYETNHLVSSVVYKMAEYPITDIIYDTPNKELAEIYRTILEDEIDIKKILIEIGLDYFVYGNAFITTLVPFKRVFKCSKCGQIIEPQAKDGRRNWRVYQNKLVMTCPVHHDVPVEIVDIVVKTNDFKVARWDPMRITIEYSELAQKTKIYYDIPRDEAQKLLTDPEFLKNVRRPFLDALLEGKRSVLFEDDYILAVQRPSISHEFKGWGLPPILHVMQALFYLQMLRRAQFAIAEDRLLNFRYLYPPSDFVLQNGPFSTNLAIWKEKTEEALAKWRENPNYMPIFPLPIAYGSVGGEGKSLMVFPEIEEVIKEIITGLQVPQELVFGGLTWSGSSISLRIMENHYLNYRRYLTRVINSIVKTISEVKDIPQIDIRFRPFRMADDMQRAQIKLQLSSMDKISNSTLLEEFDIDAETEMRKKIEETKATIASQYELQAFQQEITQPKPESENEFEPEVENTINMNPMPDQKPPRRQGGI